MYKITVFTKIFIGSGDITWYDKSCKLAFSDFYKILLLCKFVTWYHQDQKIRAHDNDWSFLT